MRDRSGGWAKDSFVRAVCALVVLVGCGQPVQREGLPADVVAVYRGGVLHLADLEAQLRRAGTLNAPAAGVDELVARYRAVAEATVLEHSLLGDLTAEQIERELGQHAQQIAGEIRLRDYLRTRLGSISVSAEEIEDLYASKQAELNREASVMAAHIFRRHRDPQQPEQTLELLETVKRRVEEGESFAKLATELSDSENRAIGGRLGFLNRGSLPVALERTVFGLQAGGVSEPLEVPGGAAIFYVSQVVEERSYTLDEVRQVLLEYLLTQRRRERIAELVGDRRPPEGSIVLTSPELAEALAGQDPGRVVLEVGSRRVELGQLHDRLSAEAPAATALLSPTPQERATALYQDLLNEALLLEAASEVPLVGAAREQYERLVSFAHRQALSARRIEAALQRQILGEEPAILQFFEDNRHLYQTPLSLRLQSLVVPAGARAPQRLRRMEEIYVELSLGALDLDEAAARVGGRVIDHGWLSFEELTHWETKVRHYVLDLDGVGYTAPFQLDGRINVVWVQERKEPQARPYEEVAKSVERDYLARHRPRLVRELKEKVLRDEELEFREDAVRAALLRSAASGTTGELPP